MGYKTNSPIKQVWLPIEFEFITQNTGSKFGDFAKAYKEKYGIDLHDIFGMNYNEETEEYGFCLKTDIVSCYVPYHFYDKPIFKTKLATVDGVRFVSYASEQGSNDIILAIVGINSGGSVGWGFSIMLPATGVVVESVDDLKIEIFEI